MALRQMQHRGCFHDRVPSRCAGSGSCSSRRSGSRCRSFWAATLVVAGAVCALTATSLHLPHPPLLFAAYRLRAIGPVHVLEWPDLKGPRTGVTFQPGRLINIDDSDSFKAIGIQYWKLTDHHGWISELGTDGIWNGKPIVEKVEIDIEQKLEGAAPLVKAKGAKLRLSPEAVARVETADTRAKDTVKLGKDERSTLKPTAAGQRKAVSFVRRLMQRLSEATTPLEFDSLHQQLKECLDKQWLQLGPKRQRLKVEVQQLLLLHERRIAILREAQEASLAEARAEQESSKPAPGMTA